jgi:hypothetical protein
MKKGTLESISDVKIELIKNAPECTHDYVRWMKTTDRGTVNLCLVCGEELPDPPIKNVKITGGWDL